jgi:hypothetical protein
MPVRVRYTAYPTRALALTTSCFVAVCLVGCKSAPVDPTANLPLRPIESARRGEKPPAALAPALGDVPPDERAPHTATRIEVSRLSRIDREAGPLAIIELRIDAFDASGAPAVFAGDLRLVLKTEHADPCYLAFDAPLATKRQVQQRTDPTLGQVVVRLEPMWRQEPAPGEVLQLTATLTGLDGKVTESALRLIW